MRISYPEGDLTSKVKYCVFRETAPFLGVDFEPGARWSPRSFRPQHLLDPRRMAASAANRVKSEIGHSLPN
jgi:hypothetical protein